MYTAVSTVTIQIMFGGGVYPIPSYLSRCVLHVINLTSALVYECKCQWWNITKYSYSSTIFVVIDLEYFHFKLLYSSTPIVKYCCFLPFFSEAEFYIYLLQ